MTKRVLDSKGFSYVEAQIYEQPEDWLNEIAAEGLKAAPIVQIDHENGGQIRWAGFRPDLLNNLEVK